MFFYDSYYLFLVVPAILISLYAQMKVKSTFNKYSQVMAHSSLTATEITRRILDMNGLQNVKIEQVQGSLSDHFDPKANVIRLSDTVRGVPSVAAIGVASHEAGHAIQYKCGYTPIKLRNTILPVANLGSQLSVPLIIFGILFSFEPLVSAGILLFSAVLLFQVVTLPVEFNASKRAIATLSENNILDGEELDGAKKVLRAAALTYVAAVLVSAMQLLRLLLISRRRNR